MIEISEYSKKHFKLNKKHLNEISRFMFFLNTKKNITNPDLKIIDKKSFMDFHLYAKRPLYKQISRSLLVYVD